MQPQPCATVRATQASCELLLSSQHEVTVALRCLFHGIGGVSFCDYTDLSHFPPRKLSSAAPSPIPRPTGPEQSWRTNTSPGRQTVSPPPAGQMPTSTPLIMACTQLLDSATDPTCPLCKKEPQTLEHWLQRCPNLDALRQHTFGSPSPPLGVFTTDPKKVLALARATF